MEDDWGVILLKQRGGCEIYVKFVWGLEEAIDPAELQKEKQIPAKYRAGYISTTVSGTVTRTGGGGFVWRKEMEKVRFVRWKALLLHWK